MTPEDVNNTSGRGVGGSSNQYRRQFPLDHAPAPLSSPLKKKKKRKEGKKKSKLQKHMKGIFSSVSD